MRLQNQRQMVQDQGPDLSLGTVHGHSCSLWLLWAARICSQPFHSLPYLGFHTCVYLSSSQQLISAPQNLYDSPSCFGVILVFAFSVSLCMVLSTLWFDNTEYWPVFCFVACHVHGAHPSSPGGLYRFKDQIASVSCLCSYAGTMCHHYLSWLSPHILTSVAMSSSESSIEATVVSPWEMNA